MGNELDNYYSLLGISPQATEKDIKRAFREKAKRLHPDIAGKAQEGAMRKLILAYEVLLDEERRYEYDRAYRRFTADSESLGFDYPTYLRAHPEDPACQAKLIFFDLLHLEEEEALEIWKRAGGIHFPLDKYLDWEDYMDCAFLVAEELIQGASYFEAFVLLTRVIKEERRFPYFKHFTQEIETILKELVRLRLKPTVDEETYIGCMETLLDLDFPPKDQARWMRSLAETLLSLGDQAGAQAVFQEALKKDPALSGTVQLRRRLKVQS